MKKNQEHKNLEKKNQERDHWRKKLKKLKKNNLR